MRIIAHFLQENKYTKEIYVCIIEKKAVVLTKNELVYTFCKNGIDVVLCVKGRTNGEGKRR